MARPRAATDEQIIQAAEGLAAELGWQNVYAKTVYETMGVGGSLSTFSKVIKKWRAEKETQSESVKIDVPEIVEDRASVVDDGITEIVDTLKKLRHTVNAEIDRATSDERRKSERLREDDRSAHEKAVQDLRDQIDALGSEIDELATEASSEGDRAEELSAQFEKALKELGELQEQVREIPILEQQIKDLKAEKEALASETTAQIEKAESREAAARAEVKKRDDRITEIEKKTVSDLLKRDVKIEKLEGDLQGKTEDLATARVDLANARSERTQADQKCKELQSQIDALTVAVKDERNRADSAWNRVEQLEKIITSTGGPA